MKIKLLILLSTMCLFVSEMLAEESVSVVDEQEISSIILRNGWLYLISPTGDVLIQERIADVRTIVFPERQPTTDIVDVPYENVLVYPNPTNNTLIIQGESMEDYRIFDREGHLLTNGTGNIIDVSSLSTGTYLLQINNHIFKFIKQ